MLDVIVTAGLHTISDPHKIVVLRYLNYSVKSKISGNILPLIIQQWSDFGPKLYVYVLLTAKEAFDCPSLQVEQKTLHLLCNQD